MDNDTITAVHGRIAGEWTPNFATGLPSADTVRALQAFHRSLAYGIAEIVSSSRMFAQRHAYIATLEHELKIEEDDPPLFLDLRRI